MDSKKLLVLSDTHGNLQLLKKALEWAKDRLPPVDSICAAAFLGDGLYDLQRASDATGFYSDWKIVSGNNDYEYSVPETAVFDFGENRFLMCHGHRHSLYGGYHSLVAAARNTQVNVVLFGHTHVPFQKTIDGVLLVNPGSVGRPRSRVGASFAVIECAPSEPVKVEFFGVTEKAVKKLKIH